MHSVPVLRALISPVLRALISPVLRAPIDRRRDSQVISKRALVSYVFSRRVVGWSMAEHRYASHAYQRALEASGITCSVSRRGNCRDNAVAESFFSALETELVNIEAWRSYYAQQQRSL